MGNVAASFVETAEPLHRMFGRKSRARPKHNLQNIELSATIAARHDI